MTPSFQFSLLPLIFSLFFSWAVTARVVPPLTGPVVDEARVLDQESAAQLTHQLQLYKEKFGPQIQVLIISSLEGDPIEDFSIRTVDQWKLGTKKEDNGVLFLIAVDDRKMRIEVGQGLEGDLPDITAGKIIRAVGPYFKEKRFQDGIFFGVRAITQALGHEIQGVDLQGPPITRSSREGISLPFPLQLFLFFIFLIFFLFQSVSGSRFGRRRSRDFYYDGGSWGGFRGGGSGGSSWGGGGGGFSGGGASGDW